MPRKQRFKPSRKPKPPITEVAPDSQVVQQHRVEDLETAQTTRTPRDTSSVIEETEGVGK
jgi:hypothetical protein